MQANLLKQAGRFNRHHVPALSVAGIALILFAGALWGPEDIRTPLYLGALSLIVLIVLRQLITTALENRLEELKRTQAQLIQSEKMAAVGQLVSGVAHELNNPLTSILGFAEILANQPGLDAMMKRDLDRIYQEAERSRRIIQNLLHFARQEEPSRTPADINEVLNRTLAILEYQLRVRNIAVVKNLDPGLPITAIDIQQFEQIFLNIVINAEQAIQETGKEGEITVTTQLGPSDKILISFKDNGPGIAPEHLPKIFEPFFTTKEVGKGTGLGLSLSYGIIKQHGGKIRVESKPGQGACFRIELPISKETGLTESLTD